MKNTTIILFILSVSWSLTKTTSHVFCVMGLLEQMSYTKRASKKAQVTGNANKTAVITAQVGKKSKKEKLHLVTEQRPSTLVLPQKKVHGAINSVPNTYYW